VDYVVKKPWVRQASVSFANSPSAYMTNTPCDIIIVILYQGSVVEQGNAQEVIRNPQHTYTKLLISSIPIPDPDIRWEERLKIPEEFSAHE
jgi:ABC-type oligopeptide transport system ATPase subunit